MLAIPPAEAGVAAGVAPPRVVRHAPAARPLLRAENRRPRYANGRGRRVMQSVTAGAYPERSGQHMRLHTEVGVAVRATRLETF